MVSTSINELRQSNNHYSFKKWDAAGFDVCVFPIVIENDFVGTVTALGFFKEENSVQRIGEVRERLAAFGCTNELIEKSLGKLQYLNDTNRSHFCELVELVAQEVVTLHVEISSRENKITELNKELGNRYKYDNMIGKSKPMQSLYALIR
jgi:two-component system response regulator HupR/HoxA